MWLVVLLVVLSATWMSVPASAATCPLTPNLSDGYYTTSISSFTSGGTATANCFPGYQRNRPYFITCGSNGTWPSGASSLPTCTSTTCSAAPTMANGYLTFNSESFMDGGSATASCFPGYKLTRSPTISCGSGQWSSGAFLPTCTRVLCSSHAAPSNGAIASMSLEINGATIFTCNSGYNLVGSSASVCLPTGTWSTLPPMCQNITCSPPLTSPVYGKIASSSNDVGGATYFTCNSGFALVGTSASVCTSSGSWSQPAPTCQEIMCSGSVTAPTNGHVTGNGNTFSSVRQFSCMEGYQLSGTSYTICLANGTWSTASPVCTLMGCLPLDAPGNGSIVSSSPLRTDFACDDGFAIIGDPSPMCLITAYNWTSGTPTCAELPECPDLTVDNADVLSGSSKVNSTRVVTCTPGFEMLGDSMVVCLDDGNWSSIPICIHLVDCNPLMVTNGKVSEGQNTVGSIRTVLCNADHELSGDRTIVCLEDGSWSSSSTCKATGPPVALIPSTEVPEPTEAASTFLSQGGSVALIVFIGVLFMMLLIAVIAIVRLRRDFPEHMHEVALSYNNKREKRQMVTLTHSAPIPENNLYATVNKPQSATPAVQMEVAYTDLTFTTPPADSPAGSQV
ncbi:sushi, von Willebrand factor type A, EGF and pentraxin domain-containing protein 1-like isoform X2 [Sycon ciliatum]|uniref:sushi, von Willebrand factor type A, EGF and pentraxin domain-containing protein 1-like isoform X2 n=1 Tax=Sycon ciliatum TaxID=27933 RepID=UPI0031F68217